MSLILGIDTSSTDLGIGLYRDNRPAASYSRFLRNSHAETIAAAVSLMLDNSDVAPADISAIAVSAGPGSFTGLRIGMAFVKGFCLGSTLGVLPVSSLFILAHGGLGRSETIVAAIDARRDDVFWARFRAQAGGLVRETPDLLSPVAEFGNAIQPGDAVITDTMSYAKSTVFSFLDGQPNMFPVERFPILRGLHCAAAGTAALGGEWVDGHGWTNAADIIPRYLRSFASPPQAARS